MKRRNFIAGTTAIMAGQLGVPGPAMAQVNSRTPSRITRLFDASISAARKTFVQDVAFVGGLVYCLFTDFTRQYWGVTIASSVGGQIAHYDLPAGQYLTVGVQAGDIMLHALSYRETADHAISNCFLRVTPGGIVEPVQAFGPSFTGKVFFAGDSAFVKVDSTAVEVWSYFNSSFEKVIVQPFSSSSTVPHIDLVAPSLVALTRREGTSVLALDMQAGSIREDPITSPVVSSAIANYGGKRDTSRRGTPIVIPATGTDSDGNLYALVFPASPDAVPGIKFTAIAQGSAWLSFQLPTRAANVPVTSPLKILVLQQEVGLVSADGSVVWYPA